jgi:hypothetical protein
VSSIVRYRSNYSICSTFVEPMLRRRSGVFSQINRLRTRRFVSPGRPVLLDSLPWGHGERWHGRARSVARTERAGGRTSGAGCSPLTCMIDIRARRTYITCRASSNVRVCPPITSPNLHGFERFPLTGVGSADLDEC